MLNVKNMLHRLQVRAKLPDSSNLASVNWQYYLPLVVSTALVLLLLYIFITSVVFFLKSTQVQKTIATTSVSKPNANLITEISQWHLFGLSTETKATALTSLPLKLLGVLVQTPAKTSEAIIREEGGKEKIYHVDDVLPDGAVLYEVRSDSVIIQYKGRLEKLMLNKTENTPISSSPSAKNNQNDETLSSEAANEFLRKHMRGLGNAE